MLIKHRNTFFVSQNMAGPISEFSTNVNVEFVPDELRIVQLFYTGAEVGLYTIVWDGVGKIGMFAAQIDLSNVNVRINVHGKKLQGLQNFRIVDHVGAAAPLAGILGIVFEAVAF